MPVTSFALALFSGLLVLALTIWGFSAWGAGVMVPVTLCVFLAARWAMAPVSHDDSSHP